MLTVRRRLPRRPANGSAADAEVRVTIVTGSPPKTPGALAACTAARPISRHSPESRFARCCGLPSHRSSDPLGLIEGDDQSRFSPTAQ